MKKSQFLEALKEGLKGINEVSPELFQRTSDKMQRKGQDNRSIKLGNTFFHKFIGKNLFSGNITNIIGSQGGFDIYVERTIPDKLNGGNQTKQGVAATYNIENDSYKVGLQCTRIDARILALIAQKVNPNTKYLSGTQDLPVAGY